MPVCTSFFEPVKVQSMAISNDNHTGKTNVNKPLRIWVYKAFSEILFIILSKIVGYRKDVILQNFRNSFPEIPKSKEAGLVNSYYRHLSDLLVELFLLNNLKTKEISHFVRYENIQLLKRLYRSGKDILLLASHYGNWEYLLTLPLVTDYEVIAVYSPISNAAIDQCMLRLRSRFGVRLVKKSDWYRTVLKENYGKPRIYVMIADQRPVPPYKNPVHFLGKTTFVQAGCERIGQKLNCAIVYTDVEKMARHRYKFKFKLMRDSGTEIRSGEILEAYYRELEKTILRNPSCWLWSHNRWKNHEAT